MKIISIKVTYAVRSYVWAQWTVARWSHKQMNPMLIYVCCIRHIFLFLNTDFVGSINTRNICLILSTIYNFISVSVCIDMGLSALLWPGPILLTRRPWPYVIHHLHFMNIYRLYIAWYRPILLMYVGCINWYFRNKTLFLWLKRPYFHFTDTGVYYPLYGFRLYNGWYHPRTSTS
jgi:hypothetical protein